MMKCAHIAGTEPSGSAVVMPVGCAPRTVFNRHSRSLLSGISMTRVVTDNTTPPLSVRMSPRLDGVSEYDGELGCDNNT